MTTTHTTLVDDATAAPRARVAVGAALILAAGAVGSWVTWRAAAAASDAGVARALDAAPLVYRAHLDRERVGLRALGRALAGDTRIRSTLALAATDERTVRDVLQDLKAETRVDVLAVLDGKGIVRAAVGASNMVGVNLAESRVITAADARESALNLWLGDREGAVVVAAAQVTMGPDVGGYVVVGRALPAEALAAVAERLGLTAALVVNGQAASPAPASPAPAAPAPAAPAALERRDELATAPAVATVWTARARPPPPTETLAAVAAPAAVACIAVALLIALSSSRRPAGS